MKMSRTRVNIVLLWSGLLGVGLTSPGAVAAPAPPFEVVRTGQAEGAIVPAHRTPSELFGLPMAGAWTGAWTPARSDVERLEVRLPEYLREAARAAPRPTGQLGVAPAAEETRRLAARLGGSDDSTSA